MSQSSFEDEIEMRLVGLLGRKGRGKFDEKKSVLGDG
jgi:hypothetical protein